MPPPKRSPWPIALIRKGNEDEEWEAGQGHTLKPQALAGDIYSPFGAWRLIGATEAVP